MARRFRLGLTGGVGSGKSTVARILSDLGADVVDTDAIARQLTAPGGAALPAIRAAFGAGMIDRDGALDRVAMRARVFADPDSRRGLEAILHPLIREESLRQIESARGPYVVIVVPLLAENLAAYRPLLDRIAVVDCDESRQLLRTAARPGVDMDQARAILASQAGRLERMNIADDVIENRADLPALRESVRQLHALYLHLATACLEKNHNNSLH